MNTTKKYNFYFGILLIGFFSLNACEDFLEEEPKGDLSEDNFFNSVQDIQLAATAVYNEFAGAYNQASIVAVQLGAHDLTTHPVSNKERFREFDRLNVQADNDRLGNHYYYLWRAIWNVNFILDNFEKVKGKPQEIYPIIGEMHFFRALSYYNLVRLWGDMPIIINNEVDYNIEKSSVADIYDLIITDLDRAIDLLPYAWGRGGSPSKGVNGEPKRGIAPNRGAAKAVLAEVYLTMAGWPLKDESKYADAARWSKEVIDSASFHGFDLVDITEVWMDSEAKTHAENIFGVFFDIAIPDWPAYTMLAPLSGKPEEEKGWCDYFTELQFFRDFPEGPRKDETFQTIIDGKSWETVGQKHPYMKKWTHVVTNENDWRSSKTTMVYRYAHVLLTYAEAQAMADGGPNEDAYNAVNAIRTRAGLPDLTPGLTAMAFQDSVVAERIWEFTGEPNGPWYDLIRLEKLAEALSTRDPAEAVQLEGSPDNPANWWFPFVENDQLLNPNLR